MSIKKKLIIAFSATLFVFVLIYSLTTEFFIIKGFKELEQEHVEEISALVLRILNLEEENLDELTYDWASWDDVYNFIENRNIRFIESNFTPEILRDLGLSFIYIADTMDKTVYYQESSFNKLTYKWDIPPNRLTLLRILSERVNKGKQEHGIISVGGWAYFVSARPILRSDDTGPPNGVLLLAKKASTGLEQKISRAIGHQVKLTSISSSGKSASSPEQWIVKLSKNTCEVKRVIKDLFGKPSLALEILLPRKITKYGSTSAHLAIIAEIVLGALLGAVLLWQLRKLIFSKVDQLTNEVVEITESGDLSRRLSASDSDELGELVNGFNKLLEKASDFSRQLMVSKEKYKTLFEQSPAGIFVFDTDFRIVECNESICKMIGRPKEALLGLDLRKLKYKRVIPHIESALKGKQSKHYGLYEATTSDARIWSSTTLAPLYGQDNRIMGGIGIVEDISEIKKYEWALEKSRAHLEAVLESASGYGILTTDLDFVVTYFNSEAGKIFGCTSTSAIGRKIEELEHGFKGLMDHFLNAVEQVKEKKVYEFSVEREEKAGERYFSCRISGIGGHDDEILGYVLFAEDITEKLRAEKERKELEEQLLHAQKMEAIGRLSGGIAHDFNNLLTGILGLCELALETVDKESETHSIIEQILSSSRKGSKLTKQLLGLSRKRPIRLGTIDVARVVGEMEGMLRSFIGEDIELSVDVPDEPTYIKADPSQVEQIVMNLVVNARDAMPNGGKLHVKIEDVEGDDLLTAHSESGESFVRLAVNDTGIGMNEEVRTRIFDPFFTTKPPGKGTGLGLSMVYGIVKQLEGFLEVESAPGEGSSFFAYFPKVLRPAEKKHDEPVKVYKMPQSPGSISILIVEDEIPILDILSYVLKREGFNVYSARTGEEALRTLEDKGITIDLLIVDLIMPGMSGTEFAAIVKRRFPGVSIIYISGYTEDIVVQRDILEWDAVFLEKPFSPEDLLKTCAMVLQNKKV